MHESNTYVNVLARYGWGRETAENTDSVLAIASTFDSLITHKRLPQYYKETLTVSDMMKRRDFFVRNSKRHERAQIDTSFFIHNSLDKEFIKYALRVKLNHTLYLLAERCCGFYLNDDLQSRAFFTYKKQGNMIEGEYAWGYIYTLNPTTDILFLKNGRNINPIRYTRSHQITEAAFIPKDTGLHVLKAYTIIEDYISGRKYTSEIQRNIYVKPHQP